MVLVKVKIRQAFPIIPCRKTLDSLVFLRNGVIWGIPKKKNPDASAIRVHNLT
jgi:hypothetical protein